MSINVVVLSGNLGALPEVGEFPNGTKKARASIAINDYWKNDAGEKQESVSWVPLLFTDRLAEVAGQYLKKGSDVTITGELTVRSFVDGDSGEKRFFTEVRVTKLDMHGSPARSSKGTKTTGKANENEARA